MEPGLLSSVNVHTHPAMFNPTYLIRNYGIAPCNMTKSLVMALLTELSLPMVCVIKELHKNAQFSFPELTVHFLNCLSIFRVRRAGRTRKIPG